MLSLIPRPLPPLRRCTRNAGGPGTRATSYIYGQKVPNVYIKTEGMLLSIRDITHATLHTRSYRIYRATLKSWEWPGGEAIILLCSGEDFWVITEVEVMILFTCTHEHFILWLMLLTTVMVISSIIEKMLKFTDSRNAENSRFKIFHSLLVLYIAN